MASDEHVQHSHDSVAEILGRAFDGGSAIPAATAELILRADFPTADKDRVDELLKQKTESRLTAEDETLLDEYLNADLLLTILKSKARQALRQPLAA